MDGTLNFDGKKYISAKRAAKTFGYASDYIGQLCRAKKVNARLVGRSWYVLEKDLVDHKNNPHLSLVEIKNDKKSQIIQKEEKYPKKSKSVKKSTSKNLILPVDKVSEPIKNQKVKTLSDQDVIGQKNQYKNKGKNSTENEKSRIAELGTKKALHIKDKEPLFPVILKKFDADAAKYIALKSTNEALNRPKIKSVFDKFVTNTAIVSLFLLVAGTLVFGGEDIKKLIPTHFGDRVKEELSFLADPYLNDFQNGYTKFKENISNANQNGNQLASSVFSADSWNSITGWVKDTAYKIIRPWLQKDGGTVIVENNITNNNPPQPPLAANNPPNPPYIKGGTGQALTTYISGADKSYVDTQISELKKYFLALPSVSSTFPNVNRYYITNQNDRIIDNVGNGIKNSIANISGSTITNSTFSGSSVSAGSGSFYSLSVSGPASFTGSTTVADLISQNYLSVGTTTKQDVLTLDGAFYIASTTAPSDSSSRLYNTDGNLYWAGNLIGGATTGNWATNGTDVWRAGGNVSFLYSSSTIYSSFDTASTTNLIINNSSFNNLLGLGLVNSGGALTVQSGVSNLTNYDWTFLNNYGTVNLTPTTTMAIWAQGGLNASSTSHFVYASSTALTVSGNSYLNALTATTFNGNTITSGTGILTLGAGKTLTVSDSTTLNTNAITLGGGEVITFSPTNALSLLTTAATSVTLPVSGTLYGTLTDSITSLQLLTSLSDETGTGAAVFATSPTFTTSISTPSLTLSGAAVNSILSTNSAGLIVATSTPTFGNFNATSTTLASTIGAGGLNMSGNLAMGGNNISGGGLFTSSYSSSTSYSSFVIASSTNLFAGNFSLGGSSFTSLLGTGLINSGGALTIQSSVSNLTNYDWTFADNYGVLNLTPTTTLAIWAQGGINASSTSHFVYASTTSISSDGNATFGGNVGIGTAVPTTALDIRGGILATASSTISDELHLSSLSDGGLSVFGGLVRSSATTTAGTHLTYSGNAFNVNDDFLLNTGDTGTGNYIFDYASTTAFSSTYASSTNAYFGSLSLNGSDLQTTLNTKQANIGVTWPITLNGAIIGFNGLATSSAAVIGNIPYFSGVNTFANVATGTISVPTGLTVTANRYAIGGDAAITLTSGYVIPLQSTLNTYANIVSTSTNEIMGQLSYWTTSSGSPAKLGSVATGTISVSGGVTATAGSYVIGSNLTLGCTTADSSNTGCLSSTDFKIFNNKVASTTLLTAGNGLTGGGNLTADRAFAIDFARANTWTGLQTFTNASSTLFSATYASSTNAYFGTLSLNGSDLATTLSGKQANIGVTWPITLNGAIIGFNGLATSSAAVIGNIPYFSGVNTFANVATSSTNVAGTIVARDGSGNFAAGTITAALTGHASSDLALTGGTLTGNLLFTDNSYDIGASGATRPRTGYFGTSVVSPYSSSTIYSSFITASTTNLIVNGESFNDLTGTGLSTLGGALNVNASQNITTLSNLTTNGLVNTSGSNGTLGVTVNGTNGQVLAMSAGIPTWVATTTAGTGLTFTVGSPGNFSLNLANANTWSVNQSFNYSSSTIYSSFITASTTNLNIGGSSFNSLLGSGLSNSSGALTVSGLGTSNFTSANISQWTNNMNYIASSSLTSAKIFVGNASNVAAVVDMSGDITISNTGLTAIGNNKVTGAMLALGSDATGDIMYYNGTDYVRLPATTNGFTLALSGGIPSWVATSTLTNLSGILPILSGGTNATSYANNTLLAFDGTKFVSTSTPTFGNFNATSTTLASTIGAGGLNMSGNLAMGGNNISGGGLFTSSYSSSTIYSSFLTASTTNLIVNGESFNDLTGTGLQISGNALTLNLANANIWTGLQTFTNASSTLFSATYASSTSAYFGSLSLNGSDLQTTLNTKQANIGVTWPITLNGAIIGFNGLATSSAAVIGNIPYFSGVNTFANVATGTISVPTGLTTTAGSYVIGSNWTLGLDTGRVIPLQSDLNSYLNGISTSSIPNIGGLAYWTGNGTPSTLGTVATGTVSGTNGVTVTAGRSVIGGALAIDCTVASASSAGCLSATDFSRFNSATTTFSGGLTYSLATNIASLDMTNANTWTGLQTFTNASSTLFSSTYASSTSGYFGTLSLTSALSPSYGGTGLTALGTGVATWLGTPSSANLASALTDEVGIGYAVFNASPNFTGKVGIATTSAYAALSVVGSSGTLIAADAITGFTGTLLDLKLASTSKFTVDYNGNITTGGALTLSGAAINSILSTNGTGGIVATSTPTFGNFNATSTTLASTIGAGGLTISGALTATTFNGNTITSGSGILTLAASKTLTVSDSTTLNTNAITLAGGEVITFSPTNALSLLTTAGTSVTLPTSGTLYGTKTDSITSAQLAGSLSDETGTGLAVFATSPTFTTGISTPAITLSGAAVNSILSTNATGGIVATSTPTFGNFNATSTVATSTLSTGGLTVGTNQFVIQQNSGSVGIGTNLLSAAKFKVALAGFSISDSFDNQNKIASMANVVESSSKLQLVQAVCGSYTVTGLDGLTYGTVVGEDGLCWLDRNLGAIKTASSYSDANSYGSLYQWGRAYDGHQATTSSYTVPGNSVVTTATAVSAPYTTYFVATSTGNYDWLNQQNNNLWGDAGKTNNVCPTGFHVPTKNEWVNYTYRAGITDVNGNNRTCGTDCANTFANTNLKLPLAGYRYLSDGSVYNRGSYGFYWSSTVSGADACGLLFNSSYVYPAYYNNRAYGFAVRCVKD